MSLRPAGTRYDVPPVPEEFLDFGNWLRAVWAHLSLPPPTPVQLNIARFIQTAPRRIIIEAFRGVGKSFVTGAFATHVLLLNPQEKILVASAAKDRADAFSIFVKRLIQEMPALEHLIPTEDQRWSNVAFDVGPATNDQSPSVKSVGITGALTGSRAGLIIADDVESPKNSATQDQRAKLSELVKEFDAVLKPGGRVIYLGTPQTEFSLYNELQSRGYVCRIWPARYPDEKRRISYGDRLAPRIIRQLDADPTLVGKPVDPKRFSEIDLLEREASYGRSGFALQFMLDTSLSDMERYPLRLSDLIVTPLDKEMAPAKCVWASAPEQLHKELPCVGFNGDRYYRPLDIIKPFGEFTGSVMAIDPSGRGKDETGYAVVKVRHGQLYCTAAGGLQGGYEPDTLKALAVIAMREKVKHVVIEDNFGDGMYSALFRPVLERIYPVTVEEVHSVGQKELRIIDALEPVMNQHRLVICDSVVRGDYSEEADPKKSLFYQLTRITKDRKALAHDDRLEALAMAVHYWIEALQVETDKAITSSKEALLDADLEAFMRSARDQQGGSGAYGGTWMHDNLGRFG